MQSPNRNVMSIGNSHTFTSLQTPHIVNNLSKALSTSANTLSGAIDSISRSHQPHQLHQPLPSPSQQSCHHNHNHNNTLTQLVPSFDNLNSTVLNSIVPTTASSSKLQSPDMPSTTNSFLENSQCFTPNIVSAEIQVESPKNMTIVQPAKFQPYKEVTKPFEMSDFYKYSTKFRQKTASANLMQSGNNSPQLPPKNGLHQSKNPQRHMHSILLSAHGGAEPKSPAYQ